MQRIPLRVGDELVVPGLVAHKITYVGPIGAYGEDVLDPAKGQPARLTHFSSVPNRERIQLGQRGPESWHGQLLVQARAREIVAKSVVNNTFGPNCEHITSYVRTGTPDSPQLRAGVGIALLALIIMAIA
jgi:hypothetical protein